MTDFRNDKAIYLQMADRICDDILSGRYGAGERIPSVREQSETLQVNTNTVVRAYDNLTRLGIIYTKRGMGYFVSEDARTCIMENRRKAFMEEKLPELFRQMKLLDIPIETVDGLWEKFKLDNTKE